MGSDSVILLDTHVLVWFLTGERIGPSAEDRMRAALMDEALFVSSVSGWEIAMLACKGKIDLGMPAGRWFDRALARGFRQVALSMNIAIDAGCLPRPIHRDPADHMLIATARSLGCTLLTADKQILAYAAAGHVQAIDARA